MTETTVTVWTRKRDGNRAARGSESACIGVAAKGVTND